ncbi:rhamnulokinase [Subtercola endophyticus]|uniref:rhamnulokinase n=1 Tax=Subtercola endophyticus TaxID=2895559 RepID=UPI001E4027C4|nr:rhamnulokinase family protein [Subtercola endophyticus]UFS58565.1 rhamnulokinase [Subtercola endophyticus]
MTRAGSVAAVDLGATSGRVMAGHVGTGTLELRAVHRFPNTPVRVLEGSPEASLEASGASATQSDESDPRTGRSRPQPSLSGSRGNGGGGEARYGLRSNILELYRNVVEGLRTAVHDEPEIASIGIDSWAVDYALLRGGRMLGSPYNYRDDRTAAGVEAVRQLISADELYSRNGLQHLPFNTVFQLAADRASGDLAVADRMLLIPDLLGYWLTGQLRTEITNASTTGLLDPNARRWDTALLERVGIPASLLPALIEPGQVLGSVLPEVANELGLGAAGDSGSGSRSGELNVVAVGSHDTASAVVAVPATGDDFAYISSGTWSLVGVELEHPVISEAGRAANFTNEGGVDGRVRYLKNVSGLWLLSESVRTWERESGSAIDLATLLAQAAAVSGAGSGVGAGAGSSVATFDTGDDRFLPPGDMPARIAAWFTEHGMPAPHSPAEFTRTIIESLAADYAATIAQAEELTGKRITTIHIVGGGSLNTLLCQLTADRTGRTVLAGPVEATALGNVLVQGRAAGMIGGTLESMRALVASTFEPRRYVPAARR